MAFRISKIKSSGEREESVLINNKEALISSSKEADLKADLPENSSIKICETSSGCTLIPTSASFESKGQVIDKQFVIGYGGEFKLGEQLFYVTVTRENKLTEFKKGHLATVALLMTWSLLAIQIIVPVWLPYKITSHKVEGRNMLLEKCSTQLDSLRRNIKNNKKAMTQISPIHNDVMNNLQKEVDQISAIFREGREFMTTEQLKVLEEDISLYNKTIKKLLKSSVIEVAPLNPDKVIEGLAL